MLPAKPDVPRVVEDGAVHIGLAGNTVSFVSARRDGLDRTWQQRPRRRKKSGERVNWNSEMMDAGGASGSSR
jgi:hypothetical protein